MNPRRAALVCSLIAVVAYLPALRNGFAYDDAVAITSNPLVASHAFASILATPYHNAAFQTVPTGVWRPLTTASFALDHLAFGFTPAALHAVSVLWHALATALVVLAATALGLSVRAAVAGGLLFALHPVHVEAVAALAGRGDVIATALALGAVIAAARARATLSGLLFFAALLAKEAALPLLVLLPAVPFLNPEGDRSARVKRLALASAVAATVYLALRLFVLGGLTLPEGAVTFYENPVVGLAFGDRLLTVAGLLARTAGLIVAPLHPTPDYGFAVVEPARGILDPIVLAGIGVLAALTAWAALFRRDRTTVFLLAWCAATWLIVSNLVFVIGTPIAERQLYLPSVGACLLAGLLVDRACDRVGPRAPYAILGLVLLGATILTTRWTRAWESDATLFEAAYGNAPRSLRVLGNLAVERADAGRLDDARALLERAVVIAPEFPPTLVNLSGIVLEQGDAEAAIAYAERAVAADPRAAAALAQLAVARWSHGDLDGAEAALRRAVDIDPRFVDARWRLARLLASRGRLPEAREQLVKVLEARPDHAEAREALAAIDATPR